MIPLFWTMVVLALLPSPSVFAVVARSMSVGLLHGILTAIGITVGDFVFILLAIGGLSAIAHTMDILFVIINSLGAAYLMVMGVELWRSKPTSTTIADDAFTASGWSSFACGVLITLGDPKAILFYVSFFPAFVDISSLTLGDTAMILGLAAIAVGGTKMVYAYLADSARVLFKHPRVRQWFNRSAAIVMVATGVFLILKL